LSQLRYFDSLDGPTDGQIEYKDCTAPNGRVKRQRWQYSEDAADWLLVQD
jgi:hypothetical protein